MTEILEKYNPVRLDLIKNVLESASQKGKPRFYEIYVDGLKVVEKTNNPDEFDKHEECINADTKRVIVNLFTATESSAHIVSRHIFTFIDEPKSSADSFRGYGLGEVEARITEKVTQERERWECDQVKKELEAAKNQIKESEEWNEKLEGIIDETKKKLEEAESKSDFAGIIKDLALPHIFPRKAEEKPLGGSEKPKEEATFTMNTEEKSLSEDDKFFLDFGKNCKTAFSKEEFEMVLDIISEFVKDKTNIKPVTELLNIKPTTQKEKQNGKV